MDKSIEYTSAGGHGGPEGQFVGGVEVAVPSTRCNHCKKIGAKIAWRLSVQCFGTSCNVLDVKAEQPTFRWDSVTKTLSEMAKIHLSPITVSGTHFLMSCVINVGVKRQNIPLKAPEQIERKTRAKSSGGKPILLAEFRCGLTSVRLLIITFAFNEFKISPKSQ